LALSKFTVAFFKTHDLYWTLRQILVFLVFVISLAVLYLRSGEGTAVKFPELKLNLKDIKTFRIKKRKKPKKIKRIKKGVDFK
jgi:hypothetical protein